MPLVYTTDELITETRNIGMFPDTASTGSEDDDIRKHLTAILQSKIAPAICSIREEYYVASTRTTLTANTSRYRLPQRAMGNKLRDLFWVDGNGYRQQVDPVQREDLQEDNDSGVSSVNGYYIEGNYVVIHPSIGSPGGSLELVYFNMPGDLVITTSAGHISAVDTSTGTITCDADVPSTWSTSNTFDIHSFKSGAETKLWSLSASDVGTADSTQIVFSDDIDGTTFGTYAPEVGDWVCLAGEAVIPAIPRDFHSVLVRGAAMRMCEALGDAQNAQIHGSFFQSDMQMAIRLMENRVEGKPMRIIGRRAILRA